MGDLLTETDPRVLVPGDADHVIEVARRIRVLADEGLRPVIECLDPASASGRAAGAGDRARHLLLAERSFWVAQADILDSLATAFDRYAVAIRAAQTSAARAAQSAAWARAAFPYPAAWTAYGHAATELRDARVRLGEAADLLADAVERAAEVLPRDVGGAGDQGAVDQGVGDRGAGDRGAGGGGAGDEGAGGQGADAAGGGLGGAADLDWHRLGRRARQVSDELAAVVAGGLLAAVGLGDGGSGPAAMPPDAAALPDIALPDLGALGDLGDLRDLGDLPGPAPGLGPHPGRTGSQVQDLLTELDRRCLPYTLAQSRESALLVSVALPGQRWEVGFGEDGAVGIEVFTSDGSRWDGAGLADLWRVTSGR